MQRLMVKHTATTKTDSQWLPTQDHSKGDPTLQKPREPETADFCTTRLQLRHSSENEVAEVELALSKSGATQLGDTRNSVCGFVSGRTRRSSGWQEVAAHVPATLALDSRGVYDELAGSESSCLGP